MEPAIEREHTWVFEYQDKLASICLQGHVYSPMPRRIERVIAHHGMVVGVVVDPNNWLTYSNGDGERGEAVFVRHDNLGYRRGIPGADILAIGV